MSVLDHICADKRAHIERKKAQFSLSDIEKLVKNQTAPRGFIKALSVHTPAFITEVKKASPSKGVIREGFDAVEIAKTYEENGATCLSVLTDEPYFQGMDMYLSMIRKAVSLPLLRKDFIIDPYQIPESRALGADCILLIMACLNDDLAAELYQAAGEYGMDVLVEVHDKEELDRAMKLSPSMVGVNNRNLKTLAVDLQTGIDLAKAMPENVLKVAESGISSPAEIARFRDVGYQAFLVGESLMREADIGAALRKLRDQS
jgi:indole-3-glycerol phosphate synthase